jgi:hypothetical protein
LLRCDSPRRPDAGSFWHDPSRDAKRPRPVVPGRGCSPPSEPVNHEAGQQATPRESPIVSGALARSFPGDPELRKSDRLTRIYPWQAGPDPSWCIVQSSSRAATDATKSGAAIVVVALTSRCRSASGSQCPAESWRWRCSGTMWGQRLGGLCHNYCLNHLVLPRSAARTLRRLSLLPKDVARTRVEWSIRRAELLEMGCRTQEASLRSC